MEGYIANETTDYSNHFRCSNLEKSLHFRDGLGPPTERIVGTEFEHGAVAFFDLQTGLKLAIKDIAHETKVTLTAPGPAEFTLRHNVNSKAEVDKVMEQTKQVGATITDPAHDTFLGRILRSLPRPRWALMGNRLESALGYN